MIWLSVLISFAVLPIDGSRILAIITVPAYSHQVVYQPLWKALSLRGHEVTVLTSNPVNDPALKNLIKIDTSSAYDVMRAFNPNNTQRKNIKAILNKVPIIGFPFIADQQKNLEKIVLKEIGLLLNMESVTKEVLTGAIMKVTGNPKYQENAAKYAELLKDEPMSGLEKAVWWTEYVLRHKGAQQLRSPLFDIPTYQYFLLDVIGFFVIVITILIYITVKFLNIIARLLRGFLFKSKAKID